MSEPAVHLFGIRHHGPGSARSLKRALETLEPDIVLVEGPPDAEALLPLAAHQGMTPPVALLVYVPDAPDKAVFYPFARYSPEWLAIGHALARDIPLRFMDLPQWHRLALEEAAPEDASEEEAAGGEADEEADDAFARIRRDPLGCLAEVAGFSDGERWWDHLVESRRAGEVEVFRAIAEAMTTLRQSAAGPDDLLEERREAYMRQSLRAALKEGHEKIAVVCGAWHVPAIAAATNSGQAKADSELLKGLAKTKTAAAWVPWSYDRLSYRSGYGAGVVSPEWYDLLWSCESNLAVNWLTRAARLMRAQDLDASSAHVIEATRLAETLAALRGRPIPGLEELDEATLTVMCFGQEAPMRLIRRKLVVGERLGAVPEEAPQTPLQQDLARLQKRLRLPVSGEEKDYDLDLRKPNDLERSHLLHRLNLLQVPWGERRQRARAKGTFHEPWRLQWQVEFVVGLIDAGRWGNSVAAAAAARTADRAARASDLAELTGLVDDALLADLPGAAAALVDAIQEKSALASDVRQLMAALPPLAEVSRYGNVRRTDAGLVLQVVAGLVTRICIGLPAAAASLNDEAAAEMHALTVGVQGALALLQNEAHLEAWHGVLGQLLDQKGLHGLIAGRACRLLQEAAVLDLEESGRRLGLALSQAAAPSDAAAWLEGYLAGSGLLLIHDEGLWRVVDDWLTGLRDAHFAEVLPLLRRTFATFPSPERRQMGERVKRGAAAPTAAAGNGAGTFDEAAAAAVLPTLALLLGIDADFEESKREPTP